MSRKRTKNRKASGVRKADLTISKRIVNTKRHTVGYVINGKEYTVRKAAQLAGQGRIRGARRVGNHIQATTNKKRLSSLRTVVRSK